MSAPRVYTAINAISAELAQHGIAKSRTNEADDYKYRSIDDVLDRLAPLLAKHRLCVLPRVLKRSAVERHDEAQRSLFHVSVKVAFALTSVDDGSAHTVEVFGEALDPSDKATAKAISAAYKSAMVQTFCIPIAGSEDPDRSSPRASTRTHSAEPVQGWEQWARDIGDIVDVCESEQAIDLVQERNRNLLTALSRERADLYRELGHCFGARRADRYIWARQGASFDQEALFTWHPAGQTTWLKSVFRHACRRVCARPAHDPAQGTALGCDAIAAPFQAAEVFRSSAPTSAKAPMEVLV